MKMNSEMLMLLCFASLLTCADSALGLNFTRLEKRNLCKHRSYKLINEYSEQSNICDHRAVLSKLLLSLYRHSKRNTRLRKKRYSKVFYNAIAALNCFSAGKRTEVFSCGTCYDINYTDKDYRKVGEYRKLKLSAAYNEE